MTARQSDTDISQQWKWQHVSPAAPYWEDQWEEDEVLEAAVVRRRGAEGEKERELCEVGDSLQCSHQTEKFLQPRLLQQSV